MWSCEVRPPLRGDHDDFARGASSESVCDRSRAKPGSAAWLLPAPAGSSNAEADDVLPLSDAKDQRNAGRADSEVKAAGVGIPHLRRRWTTGNSERAHRAGLVTPGDRGSAPPSRRHTDCDSGGSGVYGNAGFAPVGP